MFPATDITSHWVRKGVLGEDQLQRNNKLHD